MKLITNNLTNKNRFGLSLIEVLVGLTITLVVLLAMTQAFRFASSEMTRGRASVELVNQLRGVEALLRNDLERLTVEAKPFYFAPTEPKGYIQIVDGSATDTNWLADARGVANTVDLTNLSIANLVIGDHDDILAGTIRSDAQPFRGRSNNNVEESHLAEVIWYTVTNDLNSDGFIEAGEGVRLFRRALLIKPSLGVLGGDGAGNVVFGGTVNVDVPLGTAILRRAAFLRQNDISVSVQPTPDRKSVV